MASEFSAITPQSAGYGAVNYFERNPNQMPDQLMKLLASARSNQFAPQGLTPEALSAFQALALNGVQNPTALDSRNRGYADMAYHQ